MRNQTIEKYGKALLKSGFKQKNLDKKDSRRSDNKRVDDASRESFPASDPPAFNPTNSH